MSNEREAGVTQWEDPRKDNISRTIGKLLPLDISDCVIIPTYCSLNTSIIKNLK